MKWSFGAAVGVAAAFAFAAPALAAVNAFLQLDGVKGESQDLKGAIELASWSYDQAGGGHTAPTGQAAGHVNAGQIQITKAHDQSSPILMQAAATGRHFKTATLFVRKAGGSQQPYLEYKLTDVLLSHYQMSSGGSSGGDRPTESLTLNFTKIETVYKPQSQDQGPRTGVMTPTAHLPPPGPSQ